MNDKQDKTDRDIRKERKLAAKTLKRARIEESGGVRPRKQQPQPNPSTSRDKSKQRSRNGVNTSHQRRRFGRVMETVPNTQKPRYSTVSIALPTSVVQNCQTHELRTQLVGQIAVEDNAAIYAAMELVDACVRCGNKTHKNQDCNETKLIDEVKVEKILDASCNILQEYRNRVFI